MLKVLAVGITVGGMVLAIHTEKAEAAEWTPRSVEQIKADITGKEYTIVWGDTLSAISEATNITVERLAQWNNISNIDLIFAGNKLVFEGNVVSLKDSDGNTVSQAVIQDQDKNDLTKPIGGGTGSNTSNNGNNGSGNTNNTANPPSSNDNGSGDNGTTTPPAGGDNGSGGGGTEVTPPPGGDNGTGGGETDPEEELYRVTPLGNSQMEFSTIREASEWGLAQVMDPNSEWFGMRSTPKPLFWSNGEVLSYSVDFH